MRPTASVTLELGPMKRFAERINRSLRDGAPGPIRTAIKQWAARYCAFSQERFNRLSRGGGWTPLAPSTIRARRHGRGGRHKRGKRALARARATGGGRVSVLRDTGTLFNTLDPAFTRRPGRYQKDVPYGIEVGFGGPGRHPKGRASIVDIASFHQFGGPRLPRREILVVPPRRIINKMANDLQRGVNREIRKAEGEQS